MGNCLLLHLGVPYCAWFFDKYLEFYIKYLKHNFFAFKGKRKFIQRNWRKVGVNVKGEIDWVPRRIKSRNLCHQENSWSAMLYDYYCYYIDQVLVLKKLSSLLAFIIWTPIWQISKPRFFFYHIRVLHII